MLKLIHMKPQFLILTLLCLLSNTSQAVDCAQNPAQCALNKSYCAREYNTFIAAQNLSNNVATQAENCKRACSSSSMGFKDATSESYYQACGGANLRSAMQCLEAAKKLILKKDLGNEIWEACKESCSEAKNQSLSVADKNKYSEIYKSCSDKIKEVGTASEDGQPLDPRDEGETNDTSAEDALPEDPNQEEAPIADDGTMTTADNGMPNNNMMNDMLRGLTSSPVGVGSMGSAQNPGINFSGGQAQTGGYTESAGTVGASNTTTGFNQRIPEMNDQPPDPGRPNQNAGGGGAGGGNGMMGAGGAGGGGVPPVAGNSRGANAGGGGGARTSIAGTQLGKVGQNSFYAGGGSQAGQGGARKTATAAKAKKIGPAYVSKGTGDGGLQRLFGKTAADLSNSGPRSRFGQTCLDTVFCSMENFFNRVERYPNSEINPTSY